MKSKTLLTVITSLDTLSSVQSETLSLVRFIDTTILKHEREIAKLRKARAVLVAREDTAPDGPELDVSAVAAPAVTVGRARKADSIGDHLMTILQGENKPLAMKTIHEKISARGKLVEYHAMTSMVAYYVKRGYVERIGPNKYQIAKTPKNGVP